MIIPVLFGANLPNSSPKDKIANRALSEAETQALYDVSKLLKIPPKWLYDVIAMESQWDPYAKNPSSSARGLLQFVDVTARGMGYDSSADLVQNNPTRERQLRGPVYAYLKGGVPFKNPASITLYMLSPSKKYANLKINDPLPSALKQPNIDTLKDYIDTMQINNRSWPFEKKVAFAPPSNLAPLATAGAALLAVLK